MPLPTGPAGEPFTRRMMLAALTALAHRHEESASLVCVDRLDPAFLSSPIGVVDDAGGLVGCFVRGTLAACGDVDPATAPLVLAVVDVDRSTTDAGEARLGDLGDAQLELAVRELGWLPRLCGTEPTSLRTAFEWARHEIRVLQATAREGIVLSRVAWPVVLVRSRRSPGPFAGGDA